MKQKPNLRRVVTQDDTYLTVQIAGLHCYHNLGFATKLTKDELDRLGLLISSEVKQAYGEGYDDAQQTCIDHYYAQDDRKSVDWDKLPENPAWEPEEVASQDAPDANDG